MSSARDRYRFLGILVLRFDTRSLHKYAPYFDSCVNTITGFDPSYETLLGIFVVAADREGHYP